MGSSSVGDAVGNSVGTAVRYSVGTSVGASVGTSVTHNSQLSEGGEGDYDRSSSHHSRVYVCDSYNIDDNIYIYIYIITSPFILLRRIFKKG